MNTILKFLLAAFMLSIMPTTNVCAQEEQTECNKRLLSCGKFYEGLAYYKDANKMYGFIDKTGKMVIPCQWKRAWPFREEVAWVQNFKEKWGLIDMTGKLITPCRWKSISPFRDGQAGVMDTKGKTYIVDKTGKIIE